MRQVAAVGLVGVDVDFELPVGMRPDEQAFQRRWARSRVLQGRAEHLRAYRRSTAPNVDLAEEG